MDRRPLGRRGEAAVADYLRAQGFTVVAQNARVGRLELDLIARRTGLVVFCEVKSARAGSTFGASTQRLSAAQQGRLRRAASQWLRTHPEASRGDVRFDAAFVTVSDRDEPRVDYYAAAF